MIDKGKGKPCLKPEDSCGIFCRIVLGFNKQDLQPRFVLESLFTFHETSLEKTKHMISRIDGPSPIRQAAPVKRASKAGSVSSSSFSEHLDEPEGVASTSAASALGTVSGVLDIQEVDDALARAAKGKLRAQDLLEKLDDLRLDLLTGTMSKAKLQRLADVTASRRAEVSDPKLGEILDEIDLRAQVELAKFTRA